MTTSQFHRYFGVDYSGAKTPNAPLPGICVFSATVAKITEEVIDPHRGWSREAVAKWLVVILASEEPTLVGIDHAFSFPRKYFGVHGLSGDWKEFLDDFALHWPTDQRHVRVEDVRTGQIGNAAARSGESTWRRITEVAVGAKSPFHFDVQGSVAKSTHAGLPWLRYVRQRLESRVHFWPFDGWSIPAGRSAIVEVYPKLWSRRYPVDQRNQHQQDAYAVAAALRDADAAGSLSELLAPSLSPDDNATASVEGWILGVRSVRTATSRRRDTNLVQGRESLSQFPRLQLSLQQRLYFRDEFRRGRSIALGDAEGYSELIHILERLGRFVSGRADGLASYREFFVGSAIRSPLADAIPSRWRGHHAPFEVVYDQLRRARNSAFHEGAAARHITADAVSVALILEDALMTGLETVGDYMVRSPVCAELWQPISFIRQTMLANSFSSLPVDISNRQEGKWRLIQDVGLAAFLRQVSADRSRRLGLSLEDAIAEGVVVIEPYVCSSDTSVAAALERCDGKPILITGDSKRQLLGIATPFDLL